MLIKTSELSGPALDWAVWQTMTENVSLDEWCPSSNWAQGGPIVEREHIDILSPDLPTPSTWTARMGRSHAHGPTPIIAAMRAFVASKLGDEVNVPKGLA